MKQRLRVHLVLLVQVLIISWAMGLEYSPIVTDPEQPTIFAKEAVIFCYVFLLSPTVLPPHFSSFKLPKLLSLEPQLFLPNPLEKSVKKKKEET